MSFKIDNANGKTALIEYYVSGAGEWVLHDKELIATLSSLKSIPDRIVSDGKDFDIQDLEILENIMRKNFQLSRKEWLQEQASLTSSKMTVIIKSYWR